MRKGKHKSHSIVCKFFRFRQKLGMKNNSCTDSQQQTAASFDLCRLSRSKETVDLASNTIRAYAREGLALYRKGRAVFFSRSELEQHIRTTARVQLGAGL